MNNCRMKIFSQAEEVVTEFVCVCIYKLHCAKLIINTFFNHLFLHQVPAISSIRVVVVSHLGFKDVYSSKLIIAGLLTFNY